MARKTIKNKIIHLSNKARLTGRVSLGVLLLTATWGCWAFLRGKAKTTGRAHQHLRHQLPWYNRWHSYDHHRKAHWGILGVFVVALLVNLGLYRIAFASDVFDTWDFSVPGDYTLSDSSALEITANKVRLKAQNYAADGNTKALYHLDDGSGTSLTDSSGNSNTAAATGSPSWVTGNLNGALSFNGSSQFASASDSASLSMTGANTLESWVKFSSPFSAGSSQYRQSILDKGKYQLYYDNETGRVTYELENSGSTSWTQQAGWDMLANNGAKVKRSWDQNGKQNIYATVKMGSNIYTALGGSTNDAEVWEYNTSSGSWTQIAGDGINSSWDNEISTNAYEAVLSLATNGTDVLYAGLGTGTNDGDVWRFKSGSWLKIGGDGLNSGWAGGSFNGVYSLAASGTTVWAGLGTGTNMGQVWVCTDCDTSPNWNGSRLGGYVNPTSRGWGAGFEDVRSMTVISGNPVVGLGSSAAGDGRVYHCTANCTTPGSATWTQRGGSNAGSWTNAEQVISLASNGTNLYVGTGVTANADANVRTCDTGGTCTDSSGWTLLGSATQWGTTKNGVYSISNNGSTLYVGVGSGTTGDDEVWRYSGSWTKVGGDNVFNGWNATHNTARSVLVDSTTVYAGLTNATEAYMWKCTSCDSSPDWRVDSVQARIGGKFVRKSWGQYNIDSVESSTTVGGKMYVGTGNNTAGDATVWELDPTTDKWSVVGGQGVDYSWAVDTYEAVWSMTNYKNKLYVGLGSTAGEAEVWRFDNPGWTKVADGSPAVGSAWSTTYESVYSLGVANGKLYAGLGASAGDGEVWECTGCDGSPTWTQVGGTASNNWGTSGFTTVSSMATYNGKIYAGLGNNAAGLAEVWRYDASPTSTSWTKVGGDGVNSSWANTKYEDVPSLVVWNNKLVAGIGITGTGTPNNDAEVWACTNCDTSPGWSQIGGDSNGSDNMGWLDANNYDRVRSMAVYNGDLFAGLGLSTGDGEVWRYNGTTWTQVGGDGLNDSWLDSYVEDVTTMVVYRGKLYVSTGNTANSDAMVWSYGDNGFLQSSTASQDTNWHHIAGRYNGTTMEILIDGSSVGTTSKTLTMSDGGQELFIGKSHGGFDNGRSQSFFEGSLDEIRISDSARSSFQTLPYSNVAQTATLSSAIHTTGIYTWDNFTTSETPSGGTVTYRLSDDGGSTWKYYSGGSWVTSSSLSQANDAATINTNITSFPVTFSGLKWQAVLQGNGNQQVTLNQVDLASTADTTAPSANASAITAYKSNGGASLAQNGWTNGPSPYFTWTAGADSQSGIKGYCLYLGQTDTADPVTTKGLLGTSPVVTGGNCQFIIGTNSIDLATSGYLDTALSTSNTPYYLNIKAIDNAGNIYPTSAQFYFRFDNTPPSNPGYITGPSGFISTKTANFTWATVGGDAPSDANSGVTGLQYRINNTTWYGDSHSGTQDNTDLLTNDGSYTTTDPPDFPNINEGVNTLYFRTWDAAGNVTTSYTTAALKINTSGAPSEPQNVQATPSTNTVNSFAFDWDPPATYVGDVNNITYCYTVNTLPSASTCTFTSGGVTALGAGPYATQPDANTFYVVARDESLNINYATYASVNFTANTPSPGMPLNTDIVDVSIKSTNNWRLAITWDQPSYVGAGISSYKVYRSTDNITFNFVGSSASTTYIDAGLSQQTYYYKVKACDSANNCGAYGTTVSMLPTGKFTEPANLTSGPEVSDISTRKAKISWSTDRGSDSKVAFGTKPGQYSASEVSNSAQVTSHTISLDNLSAGTTYYYVAKWTDEDGNTGVSTEKSFTTSPAPTVKEVSTPKVNLSSAIVQFTTKNAVKAKIYYGPSEGFGGLKIINTSANESTYSTELSGLSDGTKYYYKITTVDSENNEYDGNVYSFTTPPSPKISNLTFQPVEGEPTSTQKITWVTNVATTSQVTYGITGSGGQEVVDSKMTTEHTVIIKDLQDNSEYFLIAQSRDADGNLAVSDRQVFRTALDTRPPKVTEVNVEASIRGTGAEARGQIIVTWKTDEDSTSQLTYGEGSDGAQFNNRTNEQTDKTKEHQAVVSDLPTSRVFQVKTVSRDKSGNIGYSESQTVIIPRATDNVLSIIFNALQKIFGFLG